MKLSQKINDFLSHCTETIQTERKVLVSHGIDEQLETVVNKKQMIDISFAKKACEMAIEEIKNPWISVKDQPLKENEEVLAFNEKWIDEDKCPNGIRIGFLAEDGFISATWNMEQDCYDTVYEEGDDYYKGNMYVIEEEKKKALPNMSTHYMRIPSLK